MFHERHSRSITKSITWLIVAFAVTFIVLFLLEQDWQSALWHALVIQIVKFIVFYIHERVWNRSNFGQELRVR